MIDMEDSSVARASLFFSIIGVVLIGFLLLTSTSPEVDTISEGDIGKIVIIKGNVSDVVHRSGFTFFDVKGIEMVKFSNEELKEGEYVEISGRVALYRGELEIIVEQIKKL
jgi:DNA/RNA endonuclease YhcR with UshA esterase domain